MDREEAKRKLRLLLVSRGSLAYSRHAREKMTERKFTAHDVMKALHGGSMVEDPAETKHLRGFETKMKIQLDDGRLLEVPIVVDEENRRIIIKTTRRVGK